MDVFLDVFLDVSLDVFVDAFVEFGVWSLELGADLSMVVVALWIEPTNELRCYLLTRV